MSDLSVDLRAANLLATLRSVPVGRAQAKTWRQIAHAIDLWAPQTIRCHLLSLVEDGRVHREGTSPVRFWRDGTPPTPES